LTGEEDVAEYEGTVTANTGSSSTPTKEATNTGGRYPEVVRYASPSGGCTGTVIAPYTVITANHCWNGAGTPGWVVWDNQAIWLQVSAAYRNPYLSAAHRPAW
jgi:hypothetical protein